MDVLMWGWKGWSLLQGFCSRHVDVVEGSTVLLFMSQYVHEHSNVNTVLQ